MCAMTTLASTISSAALVCRSSASVDSAVRANTTPALSAAATSAALADEYSMRWRGGAASVVDEGQVHHQGACSSGVTLLTLSLSSRHNPPCLRAPPPLQRL